MKKKGFLKHADFLIVDIISLVMAYYMAGHIRDVDNLFDTKVYRMLMAIEILVFFAVVYFYSPYKSILRKKFTNILLINIGFAISQFVAVAFVLFCIKSSEISRLFLGYEYVIFFIIY